MLCICYRIESPVVKRPQEEQLQALFCTKAELHYDYLYEATNYNYVYPLVVTSHVGTLKDKLLSTNVNVSVEGPKGCGKTILCTMLYQLLQDDKFTNLYLSMNSFDFTNPVIRQYFVGFIEKHERFVDSKHLTSTDFNDVKQKLYEISCKVDLRVFADMSLFAPANTPVAKINQLFGTIALLRPYQLVLATSSGVRHMTDYGKVEQERLMNILKSCVTFYIAGFTEEEAKDFCSKSCLPLEDVYPYTGYNPYLLSHIRNASLSSTVKSTVKSLVSKYITTNLAFLSSNDKIKQYLQTQDLRGTLQFSYLACWRAPLSDAEEESFQETWLAKHHLAVIETIHIAEAKILPDQNDEAVLNEQCCTEVKKRILRWNFPTFGSHYQDILRNFLEDCDSDTVKNIISKEPSFAGFWLEGMFMLHYKKDKARLSVNCIARSDGRKDSITFDQFSMDALNQYTPVQPDQLYELKRAHPVIDFVGLLTSTTKSKWLVFIQVSLQSYQQHKSKLVNMFKQGSGNKKNNSWSLYTKYRHLYQIDYHSSSQKVLLLYVSPLEDKTDDFCSRIKVISSAVKQDIYMGVMATDSTFYKEMMEFNQSR